MAERRRLLAAALAVALALGACTSDGEDTSAGSVDTDRTLLDVGQRHEIDGDRSAVVLAFSDEIALTDDVYEAVDGAYAGAEVEVCGFGAEGRRAFWRLTTSDGEVAPEAPLPPEVVEGGGAALDVYAAPTDDCVRGWTWFTVAEGTEPVRLDWGGSDDAGWDVGS